MSQTSWVTTNDWRYNAPTATISNTSNLSYSWSLSDLTITNSLDGVQYLALRVYFYCTGVGAFGIKTTTVTGGSASLALAATYVDDSSISDKLYTLTLPVGSSTITFDFEDTGGDGIVCGLIQLG